MLGFGAGKIDLKINGFNFRPGDTIEGHVALTLNKPMKAKGVKVVLTGTEKFRDAKNRNTTRIIFSLEQILDGEKEYSGTREYDFKMVIPNDIIAGKRFNNETINQIADFAKMLGGGARRTTWDLRAKLDIPMGFDIAKSQQINI